MTLGKEDGPSYRNAIPIFDAEPMMIEAGRVRIRHVDKADMKTCVT